MTTKHLLIAILANICLITANADNLDNYSRAQLRAAKSKVSHRVRAAEDADAATHYPMIMEISDESAVDELLAADAIIYYRRGNILLVSVPIEQAEEVAESSNVRRESIAKNTYNTNDVARTVTNVNIVHTGGDDMIGYDGTGVICGICDTGFDPTHIAFKDRLCLFSKYGDYYGTRVVYAPNSALQTITYRPSTDRVGGTHGTHTAGTAAGSNKVSPYYGSAPGTDIAVSTSALSEMALLCGIEDILAYAKEQGKPAAINLSVGSLLGPHDGSDLVNQYLDELGKEALISFSSGNAGGYNVSLQHEFTEDNNTVGTMFESLTTWNGFDVTGYSWFWLDDSRRAPIQIVAYDLVDKQFVYESEWIDGDVDEYIIDENDEEWNKYFPGGYMYAMFDVDQYNGRYNVLLSYDITPQEQIGDNHWARYVCGWRMKGDAGMHLNAYTDGSQSFFRKYGVPGMSDGNSTCSVSNLCCNHNTICVGSMNSRNVVPFDNGSKANYDLTTDIVTATTSYGETFDGRQLPHICAPGNVVVSACSSTYQDENPDDISISHVEKVNGTKYYWRAMSGTSMAAPNVTGIMALWLQAVPTLTVEQAVEAMQTTANRDYADISDPRWGAGCIDAFAGLKYLLGTNSVANIKCDDEVAVQVKDRRVVSTSPVKIYDTFGRSYSADTALAPGIYIVSTSKRSVKINIK